MQSADYELQDMQEKAVKTAKEEAVFKALKKMIGGGGAIPNVPEFNILLAAGGVSVADLMSLTYSVATNISNATLYGERYRSILQSCLKALLETSASEAVPFCGLYMSTTYFSHEQLQVFLKTPVNVNNKQYFVYDLFYQHHRTSTAALKSNLELMSAMQKASGNSPLHIAAALSRRKDVKAIVKNGADVSTQNTGGETPLAVAEKYEREKVAKYLRKVSVPVQNESQSSVQDASRLPAVKK
jgi:hypothetical protein